MTKNFYILFFSPIILSMLFSILFIPLINTQPDSNIIFASNTGFTWPTPGYSKITSKFGYRNSPTAGASSYHGGIDIAAAEGSNILSIADGIITYTGWYGANGYSVIITHENGYKSIYGHVSPNFLVSTNTLVSQGSVIAKVGPKYIDKKNYTVYTDSTGRYTNGATTGPHLHLSIIKDNTKIDPEILFKS